MDYIRISVVSMTPLNYFSGVIDTAETISAVPLTLLKRFQVCRFALLKPILATFKAIILANTMPYAKRV
jgi:hypothetical protein